MELKYSLNTNDFLQYQLFTASKSKRIQNQKRKSIIIISLSLLVLFAILFDSNNYNRNILLVIVVTASLLFYPRYLKRHYYSHYKKFVEDTTKNKTDRLASLSFREFHIETSDETGESKINYTNLEEINEIKDYIFLKLKTGESIIFPKNKIDNFEKLKEELSKITNAYNLKTTVELNWKW